VLLQLRNRRPLSYLSLRYHDHSSFEIDQYGGVDVVDKRHGLGILQWDGNGSFVFGVAYQIELLLQLHFMSQCFESGNCAPRIEIYLWLCTALGIRSSKFINAVVDTFGDAGWSQSEAYCTVTCIVPRVSPHQIQQSTILRLNSKVNCSFRSSPSPNSPTRPSLPRSVLQNHEADDLVIVANLVFESQG